MTDERKPDTTASPPEPKPDPIEDVRKGLGLLFRAAKSAVDSLPKGKFEDAVVSGAREVGRAIENVTQTLDKQLFKRDKSVEPAPPVEGPAKTDAAATSAEEPKGPRV